MKMTEIELQKIERADLVTRGIRISDLQWGGGNFGSELILEPTIKNSGGSAETSIGVFAAVGMGGFGVTIAERLSLRDARWPVIHAPLIIKLDPGQDKKVKILIPNREVDYPNQIMVSIICYQFFSYGELKMLDYLTVLQKIN